MPRISSLALLLVCLGGCEAPEFQSPVVQTGSVAVVTDQGVTFSGRVVRDGSGDGQTGFVWDTKFDPEYGTSPSIVVEPVAGQISATIDYDMIGDKRHYLKAFARDVKTNAIIYGDRTSFVPIGSQAPVIASFEPTSARAGQVVTIRGRRFTDSATKVEVLLGKHAVKVTHATPTTVEIELPNTLAMRIANELKFKLFTMGGVTESAESFKVIGMNVTSILPATALVGDTVSLKVSELESESLTTVKFGALAVPLLSKNDSELKIRIPPTVAGPAFPLPVSFAPGGREIRIYFGDESLSAQQTLTIRNPWSLLSQPMVPISNAVSISAGGYIYHGLGDGSTGSFWRLQESSGTWTAVDNYPGDGLTNCVAFNIGNDVYVGLGGMAQKFWKLSGDTGHWTQIADFPGLPRSAALGLGNDEKGFVFYGSSTTGVSQDCWSYDPASDTWTQVMGAPVSSSNSTGFRLNGDLYISTGARALWKYKPSTNVWARLKDLPADMVAPMMTSTGTNAYSRNGSTPGYFWRYDHKADEWIRGTDFPYSMLSNTALVAGGVKKVYVLGLTLYPPYSSAVYTP